MTGGSGSGGSPPAPWYATTAGRIGLVIAAVVASTAMVSVSYVVSSSAEGGRAQGPPGAGAAQCAARLQNATPALIDDPGDSDIELESAAYRIYREQSPALIKRVGGVRGEIAPGRHLWLVSKSLESSFDSADPRNPGTGRYYPLGELSLDAQGCWAAEANVGYDEALGLVFRDVVVEVDDQTSALFSLPGPDALADGFDQYVLQTRNAAIVGQYDVPTGG